MANYSSYYADGMTPSNSTRERLIRAGLEVYDDLPLARVFAGTTTARVAEAAGVTTGSFFHHFDDAADFADALALSMLQEPDDLSQIVEDFMSSLEHLDLVEVLRSQFAEDWALFRGPDADRQFRLQMAVWAHNPSELSRSVDNFARVGDIMRQHYTVRHRDIVGAWLVLLERTGRTLVEPFTIDRLVSALMGLFEGLLVQAQVDPGFVDDSLYSDAAAALVASLTVPAGTSARLADMGETPSPVRWDQSRMSPQARSGARRRRRTRQRITDAVEGMFSRGWEEVNVTDVAEAAGVANQTVVNLFGSVRGVAASTFWRHVARIEAAAAPEDADEPPGRSMRRVLTRLTEAAEADPEPARALLAERMAAALQHGPDVVDLDIRVEVPIVPWLIVPMARMGISDTTTQLDLATTLTNFLLTRAVTARGRVAETVEMAMRLLPPGAVDDGTTG